MMILPVGAAVASFPLLPERLFGQTALNMPAIHNAVNTMNAAITRIANGNAIQGDYTTIAGQVGAIINQLNDANWDTGVKEQFTYMLSNDYGNVTAACYPGPLAQIAYNAIQPYNPNYSLPNIEAIFANMVQFKPLPGMTPAQGEEFVFTNIQSSLKSVSTSGAIKWLTTAQGYIASMDNPSASGGLCAEINLTLFFLSIVAGELAFMCAFTEVLVVICAAAAIIALIVAVLTTIAGIFCPPA